MLNLLDIEMFDWKEIMPCLQILHSEFIKLGLLQGSWSLLSIVCGSDNFWCCQIDVPINYILDQTGASHVLLTVHKFIFIISGHKGIF